MAPDAAQNRLRRRYLDHLARRHDGWSRACPGQHLTASSLIVARSGRVLLTLHARLGRWLQTGGHLEAGDVGLGAAARREASEESGLTSLALDPVPLLLSAHSLPPAMPCARGRPMTHLDVQYLVLVDAVATPIRSDESTRLGWFDLAELPEVDDSVRALVAAAQQRLDVNHTERSGSGEH